MSDYLVTETELTYEADRIRAKTGGSSPITFVEGKGFGDAIDAIPTGITPTGTINIISNGTYDVTDKATALVNVPGTTPTGTKQISITANGTTTEDVAAYANAEITVNVQGGGTNRQYIIKDGVIQPGYSFSTSGSNTAVTEESDGYVKIYVNANAYGAAHVNGVDFSNFNTAVLCLFKVSTRYGSSYCTNQYPAFSLGSGNAASGTTPDSYRVIMLAAKGNITTDVFALRTENYSSGGNIKFTAGGYGGHEYAEIFIKDLYLDSFTL